MYCTKCGAPLDETTGRCPTCGSVNQLGITNPPHQVMPQTSGKAIASMVIAIFALFSCPFVGQIVGLILGYSARNEIRCSQGWLIGDGFAIAGIVLSWAGLGLCLIPILFILGIGLFGSMMSFM